MHNSKMVEDALFSINSRYRSKKLTSGSMTLLLFICAEIILISGTLGCGQRFTSSSGSLTTPGYPAWYTADTSCRMTPAPGAPCWKCFSQCVWTITVEQSRTIVLTLDDLGGFVQPNCQCDPYLEVREGTTEHGRMLARPCGQGTMLPIRSTGNSLYIRLYSSNDQSRQNRIKASWSTECYHRLTAPSGVIMSPGFPQPYPGNDECSYLINQTRGYTVQLDFTHLSLATWPNGTCKDYIMVYDGTTIYDNVMNGPVCGHVKSLKSNRNAMLVVFHAGSGNAGKSQGFKATFGKVAPSKPAIIDGQSHIKLPDLSGCPLPLKASIVKAGYISSPGYPEPYPEEKEFTWEIKLERCLRIDLTLHSLELGPDQDANAADVMDCDSRFVRTELSVFEGKRRNGDVPIARYCKRHVYPHTISSIGNEMTLVFKSKAPRNPNDLWRNTINGFNVSFTAQLSAAMGMTDDEEVKLFDYGSSSGDTALNKKERSAAIEIPSGVAIGRKLFKYAFVLQDGRIGFSDDQSDSRIRRDKGSQKQCGQRNYPSVCAYCALINYDQNDEFCVVQWHLYSKGVSTNEQKRVFDPIDEYVKRFKNVGGFKANTVLLVTWARVLQGIPSKPTDHFPGNATFQIAIAVGNQQSYAIILYDAGGMNWNKNVNITQRFRDIDVGFTEVKGTDSDCEDLSLSKTKYVLEISRFQGNIVKRGAWVFKLGEIKGNPEQECQVWYNRNKRLQASRQHLFDELPQCPCRSLQIKHFAHSDTLTYSMEPYGIWTKTEQRYKMDGEKKFCYRLKATMAANLLPVGKECCYDTDPSRQVAYIIETMPEAGTAQAYNPSFPSFYQKHITEDKQGHYACCVAANSSEWCSKYYELRPIGKCENRPALKFAWLCCDPFIMTLDEKGYTFNGWGEYTMVSIHDEDEDFDFVLQARTDLAQTESGRMGNATVFSAFGAKENDGEENVANVVVELESRDRKTLVIYAGGEDFSRRFATSDDFYVDRYGFSLQKTEDGIEVSFASGIRFVVSVRMKSLAISLSIPTKFKDQTKGLLGNYNGDQDDDFLLPDGTLLPPGSSERQIFQSFGSLWAVKKDDSVMRYGQGEGPEDFSHPEFVPIYLDERPDEVKEAKSLCGNSLACIVDYVATGSKDFALDAQGMQQAAVETNTIMKNSMPQIDVNFDPAALRVNLGEPATFTLTGSDPDGDAVTFHTFNDSNGAVQVDSVTGEVRYTPSLEPVHLSFYTMDIHNVRSRALTVEVFVCTGCSGHGTCDPNSYVPTKKSDLSFHFHQLLCVCDSPWQGPECDLDRDGCEGNPCAQGQTCQDVPADEEKSSGVAYRCSGDCPEGYRHEVDYGCIDVDECETGSCKDKTMICMNTVGSFECSCKSGFRLNNNRSSCVDIDECLEKADDCDQGCQNTAGSYQCTCEDGYNFDAASRICSPNKDLAEDCAFSDCSQGCAKKHDPQLNMTVLSCFCFKGFTNASEDHADCVDRDECQENVCSQQCSNFDGGFSCSCNRGYQLAADRLTCQPCTGLNYGPNCQYVCRCSGRETGCHHETGCVCGEGWRGQRCEEDVDECSETPQICGDDHQCKNIPGSYLCQCQEGYIEDDSGTCIDINECGKDSLLNTCGPEQRCTNVAGSFYCSCDEGYTMSSGTCVDIDECDLGISDCQQQCINLPGSYNCDCYYGYQLTSDRTTCYQVTDICKVEEGLACQHGCKLNEAKILAECFCHVGYSLNANKQNCTKTVTCSNYGCSHTCVESHNHPTCTCPTGLRLDNDKKTCHECPNGTFGVDCSKNCSCGLGASHCDVTTGCVCKSGWEGDKCDSDVNECDVISVTRDCRDKGASCVNTPGSFRCQCADGYTPDDQGVCQDENECVLEPCGQQCENFPGGYRCLCNRGFTMSQSGTCQDIDECMLSKTNKCTQICQNVPGSYRCSCQDHFVLSSDGFTCTSKQTNICAREDCDTVNGWCADEKCYCNNGFNITTNNTCEQIERDWCSAGVCGLAHFCQQTNGSDFTCSCREGFILNDDQRSCRESVSNGCRRKDCPIANGGCVKETCFCNDGFRLTDSNMCERTASGLCGVADCEQGCVESQNGLSVTCTCQDGLVLAGDGKTCVSKQTAGCRENCDDAITACKDGSDGKDCKEIEYFSEPLEVKVDVPRSALPSDVTNSKSKSHIALASDLKTQIEKKLPTVTCEIKNLRLGSLIIDSTLSFDDGNGTEVVNRIAVAIQKLRNGNLTVLGVDYSVISMSLKGTEVQHSWSSCQIYELLTPCPDGQTCVSTGHWPTCRFEEKEPEGSDNNLVIIVPVVVVSCLTLVVVGAVAIFLVNKANKKKRVADQFYDPRATTPVVPSMKK